MSTRWRVLVMAPGATWSAELPAGRSVVVGHGEGATLEIPGAELAPRHLSLLAREEGVTAEPLRQGGQLLLNDVPISSQVVLRSGDELAAGEVRLLFSLVLPARATPTRVVSEAEFLPRLAEELVRTRGQRPLGLAVVSSPGMNVTARQSLTRRVLDQLEPLEVAPLVGQLALDLLAVALPETDEGALREALARLPGVAGPRARVVTALAPDDALDAHGLLGACLDRLVEGLGPIEPLHVDPVMVRLGSLLERLAETEGAVCFVGAPGSGRTTLAHQLAAAAGRRLRTGDGAGRKSADWLLLPAADRLGRVGLERLIEESTTRVIGVAAHRPPGEAFAHVIDVPPLRSRPDDVVPLAEAFVSRFRAAVGRPRLTLGDEASRALRAWDWPGNVRELVNVLFVAARATARDEIGRDALPHRLTGESEASSFKGAMAAAERELMLDTLGRTRWNVTAAAARLGIPRRTFVHRMARLGLKRPAR
ncbi:MAG: helix-turn-helix domain-containing protein [Myxococcaceae bacterium]